MSLNDRIKEARKRKGITQGQLGTLIGVAKTTIAGYEKNREPTAAKVGEIADALEVDVNFLFQDEVKAMLNNQATPEEMETLVKKYRELDAHGKDMVDTVLGKEYSRCKIDIIHESNGKLDVVEAMSPPTKNENKAEQNKSYLEPVAAHERTDIEVTDKIRKHDDDLIDNDNLWNK